MAVSISDSLCPQNHRCPAAKKCAAGALTQEGHAAPQVDPSLCTDCGVCAKICPTGALKLNDK